MPSLAACSCSRENLHILPLPLLPYFQPRQPTPKRGGKIAPSSSAWDRTSWFLRVWKAVSDRARKGQRRRRTTKFIETRFHLEIRVRGPTYCMPEWMACNLWDIWIVGELSMIISDIMDIWNSCYTSQWQFISYCMTVLANHTYMCTNVKTAHQQPQKEKDAQRNVAAAIHTCITGGGGGMYAAIQQRCS